jgi:hypothetical protein
MKLKTQILAIALGLAASTLVLWSAKAQETTPTIQGETTATIQGVWTVSARGVNCNDPSQPTGIRLRAIITFHGDGTMETALPPGNSTNEYGVWKRESGSNNYASRTVSFQYDDNGAFAGKGVVTYNIHLDTANSLTYSATIQFFDAHGNLVFSGCARATGRRFGF